MSPGDKIDPQKLADLVAAAHSQVATALWLSAGMILAVIALICGALRWRRAALAIGFAYAITLCFVRVGHAPLLGPIGCAAALTGLLWPNSRNPDRTPVHPRD